MAFSPHSESKTIAKVKKKKFKKNYSIRKKRKNCIQS